ncbi:hypothetical protein DFA_03659 [Cavenderia fasciculata]|uniref:Uncharacterized protein n=1 Tax=Cavenderia fasciculata TaxID=261658 RepID=F4PII1_CACFS|nr:uncharacterized protein DFA_03659 [Cavenderia fasciculata]EGG25410.1 hypothetical protein DFA_03659 [Cavenderia fasciculata]|eukprot:XP_004363261.1 hypothetical protein DFA_03659 [Cavenderia fasciculata]
MKNNKEEEDLFRKIIGSATLRTIILNHVREIRMLDARLYKIPGTKYTVELGQLNQHHRFIERKYAFWYPLYFDRYTRPHTLTLGALDTINSLLQNTVTKLVKRSIELMSLENADNLRCRHIVLCAMELYVDKEAAFYCVERACDAVNEYHSKVPGTFYVYKLSDIIEMFKSAAGTANFGNLYTTTVVFFQKTIEYFLNMIAVIICRTKKARNSKSTNPISSQEVIEIFKADDVTSNFFFSDELQTSNTQAATQPDTLDQDPIKLLEKIKETDLLYTEDLNEAFDKIHLKEANKDDDDDGDQVGHQANFGQLVRELPTENLRTIAKMLAIDIQGCFDKKNVIQKSRYRNIYSNHNTLTNINNNYYYYYYYYYCCYPYRAEITNTIKQLKSKNMIFKMYNDDGDVDASQYSEADRVKISRWYQCMCDNDGYHDVWFMTPLQAFKEMGDPKELEEMTESDLEESDDGDYDDDEEDDNDKVPCPIQ